MTSLKRVLLLELSCPDSVTVDEGGVAEFVTNATVTAGKVDYQWEISNDSGTIWIDILDAGLIIVYRFRGG